MEPGHEGTPRRRTNRAARIGLGEPDSLGCEAVEVGSLDPRLTVAAQIAVTEIIGEDEDDTGWSRWIGSRGARGGEQDKQDHLAEWKSTHRWGLQWAGDPILPQWIDEVKGLLRLYLFRR